jgi:acetyl-CoA C-acetyltransferase
MLGLAPDDPRPFTVTGALPWFGGPGSNYTTHAIATLLDRLRTDRDALGLAHALGWNLTKHALAVYAAAPPPRGWQRVGGAALQRWVDDLPHPAVADEATGRGTIETYTVVHGRDGGPDRGAVIGRLDDGRRFLAVVKGDRPVLEAMERTEQIGRAGTVRHASGVNRFDPA